MVRGATQTSSEREEINSVNMTASISYDASEKPGQGLITVIAPVGSREILREIFTEPAAKLLDGNVYASRRGTASECSYLVAALSIAGIDCEWMIDERNVRRS